MNRRFRSPIRSTGALAGCLVLWLTALSFANAVFGEGPPGGKAHGEAAAETIPAAGSRPEDIALRERVEALIAKWGNDQFAEREAATRELTALGEKLLWEPDVEADIANIEQFHYCFILPLWDGSKNRDLEVSARSRRLLIEHSDGLPVGPGFAGWCLYQAHALMRKIPRQNTEATSIRRPLARVESERSESSEQWNEFLRCYSNASVKCRAIATPREALRWAYEKRTSDDRYKRVDITQVLKAWCQRDFTGALEFVTADSFPDDTYFPPFLTYSKAVVIEEWPPSRNVREAVPLLDSLKRPFDQRAKDAFQHIAQMWIETDAEGAIRWSESLDHEARMHVTETVCSYLADNSPSKAITLAASFETAVERDNMRLLILKHLAYRSGDASGLANSVYSSLETEIARVGGTPWYLGCLSSRDAKQAVDSIDIIADATLRNYAAACIASKWAESSPVDCWRWIQSLESPAARRLAINRYARRIASRDGKAAYEAAMHISPTSSRDVAVRHVLRLSVPHSGRWAIDIAGTHEWFVRDSSSHQLMVFQDWLRADFTAAEEWYLAQSWELCTPPFQQSYFRELAKRNPLVGWKRSKALALPEDRAIALTSIAESLLVK